MPIILKDYLKKFIETFESFYVEASWFLTDHSLEDYQGFDYLDNDKDRKNITEAVEMLRLRKLLNAEKNIHAEGRASINSDYNNFENTHSQAHSDNLSIDSEINEIIKRGVKVELSNDKIVTVFIR